MNKSTELYYSDWLTTVHVKAILTGFAVNSVLRHRRWRVNCLNWAVSISTSFHYNCHFKRSARWCQLNARVLVDIFTTFLSDNTRDHCGHLNVGLSTVRSRRLFGRAQNARNERGARDEIEARGLCVRYLARWAFGRIRIINACYYAGCTILVFGQHNTLMTISFL